MSASVSGSGSAEQFRIIAEIGGDVAWVIDCCPGLLHYISASVEQLPGYAVADFHAQPGADQLANPLAKLVVKPVGRPVCHVWPAPLAALCAGVQARLARLADGDLSRKRCAREADQHRFASMLNHEFRTPLSSIDGAIQRLEAGSAGADAPTRALPPDCQRRRAMAGLLDTHFSPERLDAAGAVRPAERIDPRQRVEEGAALVRAGRTLRDAHHQRPAGHVALHAAGLAHGAAGIGGQCAAIRTGAAAIKLGGALMAAWRCWCELEDGRRVDMLVYRLRKKARSALGCDLPLRSAYGEGHSLSAGFTLA